MYKSMSQIHGKIFVEVFIETVSIYKVKPI